MIIASDQGRRKLVAALLPLALDSLMGCAARPPAACPDAAGGPAAWVVDQGWHTEIALRAEDLAGPLAGFRQVFPGAAALVFGFGKRGFLLAEAGAIEEWLAGPLPGAGAIQVKGLTLLPPEVYGGRAIAVTLPPGGAARLCAFIWACLSHDAAGEPVPAHPGPLHGSLFYESPRGYSLLDTCNTWTVAALGQAGLPVSGDGVVLARAALARIAALPAACAPR